MSTQAGVWNFDGEPVDQVDLTRISELCAVYGPDGEAIYSDGGVSILYRPFHTTLESRLERQPYVSGAGDVMTWDGRLDNRDELILSLKGHLGPDQTDVAIAMAAYLQWGTECFSRFIGDWAVVIWNGRDRELFLARDHFGIRHLFYYPTPRRVMWCTQLHPLALSADKLTLSDQYIAGYLVSYPRADLTPYLQIHSVPPSHFVQIRNEAISTHAYWSFMPRPEFRHKTDAEYEDHYCHLFRQAVRRRLRSDTRILAELSGGLDSSSIVCMADDILAGEGAETPGIDTFSFCDRTEPDEEDFLYFPAVEKKRGRIGFHADLHGTGDTLCFQYAEFAAAPGIPMREEFRIAQTKVMEENQYRVTLSGLGGDELSGQAMDPRVQMADLVVQLRLREFASELMTWSLLIRRPWIQLLAETFILMIPTPLRARLRGAKVERWINRNFAHEQRLSFRLLEIVKTPWHWLPSDKDSAQTHQSLSQQVTHGPPSPHETRYPFLDQDLAAFLLTIPRSQLLRPGARRSLQRRALRDLLPKEILLRRTKAAAGRCFLVSLEKHRKMLEGLLDSPLSGAFGYIDKVSFQETWRDVITGKEALDAGRFLQGLYLEIWLHSAIVSGVLSFPKLNEQRLPMGFVQSPGLGPLTKRGDAP